jgi:hypothetical protein
MGDRMEQVLRAAARDGDRGASATGARPELHGERLDILDQEQPGERADDSGSVFVHLASDHEAVPGFEAFSPALEGELHLALDQVSNMALEAPAILDEQVGQLDQPNSLAVSFDHPVASTRSHDLPLDGLEVNSRNVHLDLLGNV